MTSTATSATWSPLARDRASRVFEKLAYCEGAYLVSGSYAAYQYHRWRFPVEGLVVLKIYREETEEWRRRLQNGRVFLFTAPPTSRELEDGHAVVVLKQDLSPPLYERRQVIRGMSYHAPEDLCLELIGAVRSEGAIAEAAAIFVRKRDELDWESVCCEAIALGLARPVGIILDIINHEAGQWLIPQEPIDRLLDESRTTLVLANVEEQYFPFHWSVRYAMMRNKLDTLTLPYPRLNQKWGVKIALPRHVITKVLFDLSPWWSKETLQVA